MKLSVFLAFKPRLIGRGITHRRALCTYREPDACMRALGMFSGQSLFRSAQPGEACIEDGDAFRSGGGRWRAWHDSLGYRRDKSTSSPLVATVRSAATRAEAA